MKSVVFAFAGMMLGLLAAPVVHAEGLDRAAFEQSLASSRKAGAPGALLMVQSEDETFVSAVGLADKKTRVPMPTDDQLRIGSISKLFLATIIHGLAAEGVLDLDAPATKYVKAERLAGVPNATKATLAQMLNHTSGIPDYYDKQYVVSGAWRAVTDTAVVFKAASRHDATNAPGERYAYSNTNYHVLAMVAEASTGQSIAALMQARIFEPLALKDTRYNMAHPGGKIHGYGAPGRKKEDTWASAENTGPDGGVTSTAADLSVFLRALFSPSGKLNAVGKAMLASTVEKDGNESAGLGVEIQRAKSGLTFIGHTGDVYGYLSAAYYVPSEDVVVVAHINANAPKALMSLLGGVSASLTD